MNALSLSLLALLALASSLSIDDIIVPGSAVQIQGGFSWVEGALYDPKTKNVVFSDTNANQLYQLPNGNAPAQTQTFNVYGVNGEAFDSTGRRIVCEQKGRKMTAINPDGSTTTLADTYYGIKLNSPNDLALWKDGSIFFSDPPYGITPDQEELNYYAFWRIRPGNVLVEVTRDYNRPNGICFTPDAAMVYINDIEAGKVYSYTVDDDGEWSNKKLFLQGLPGPDGMKTDVNGNLYIVGGDGLRIYTPTGTLIGTVGGFQGTNLGFGGDDGKTIYITAKTSVWKVTGKVKGTPTDGTFGIVPTPSSSTTSSSSSSSSSTAQTSSSSSTQAPTSDQTSQQSSSQQTSQSSQQQSSQEQTSQQSSQSSEQASTSQQTSDKPSSSNQPSTQNPTSNPVTDSAEACDGMTQPSVDGTSTRTINLPTGETGTVVGSARDGSTADASSLMVMTLMVALLVALL